MSAMEIGTKLVEYCREGRNLEAINEFYADSVISVEAAEPPEGGERTMQGIEAVRGKNQWWFDNHDLHESSVTGPFPHGDDKFAVIFDFDVTNKPSGQRFVMQEVGIFTLEGGKIAKEEFYYAM